MVGITNTSGKLQMGFSKIASNRNNIYKRWTTRLSSILISLFLIIILNHAVSQEWDIIYDSIPSMGRYVETTNDRCYVATALNNSTDAGVTIKIDSNGKILWTIPHGGYCIKQTDDSGYIIARSDYYFCASLRKLDAYGNTVWYKKYGGHAYEHLTRVLQTPDGGYMAVGLTGSFGPFKIYIIRTDPQGNLLWDSSKLPIAETNARDIIRVGNYYYIIGSDKAQLTILKINQYGNILYQKTHNVGYVFRSITFARDSTFMVAGGWHLFKLDMEGDIIWTKEFNYTSFYRLYDIQQTKDDGFIIAGHKGYNHRLMMFLKTDSEGEFEWYELFGELTGSDIDNLVSVQNTHDNGFVTCGYIKQGSNIYMRVVKTDSLGETTVGLEMNHTNNQLILSPNPANNYITITFSDLQNESKIYIFNIKGQLVLTETTNTKSPDICIRELAGGIYVMKVENEGQTITKKFIKQH